MKKESIYIPNSGKSHQQAMTPNPNPTKTSPLARKTGFVLILLIAGFILLCTFGCATQKRCNDRYPCQSETKDSIQVIEKTVIKDTIITKTIPGDTVIVEKPVKAPDIAPVTAKNKQSTATARVKNGILSIALYNLPQTIEFKAQIATKSTVKERIKEKTVIQRVKYIPSLVGWLAGIGGACLIGVVVLLILIFLGRKK